MNRILEKLRKYRNGGIALAYSGGVDSSLLLYFLEQLHHEQDFPVYALFMHSVFQSESELAEVKKAVLKTGIPIQIFELDPLKIPELKNNPPDRCYFCKRAFLRQFLDFAKSKNIQTVMDGTNADDLKTYRPGLRALQELGIKSPLADSGITKKEIRRMAAELGLDCASKPAMPCLATRFEYGTVLTTKQISAVAAGESLLHSVLPAAENIRLRVHGKIARIELDRSLLPQAVTVPGLAEKIKTLGFQYVVFDAEGFRSGSMDIEIPKKGF